jgi:hypothetical protein
VGADLVGLRHVKVGVEGQGLLVVLAGEGPVAVGAVSVAEAGKDGAPAQTRNDRNPSMNSSRVRAVLGSGIPANT